MRSIKRLLSLLLAALMIISMLSACKDDADPNDNDDPGTDEDFTGSISGSEGVEPPAPTPPPIAEGDPSAVKRGDAVRRQERGKLVGALADRKKRGGGGGVGQTQHGLPKHRRRALPRLTESGKKLVRIGHDLLGRERKVGDGKRGHARISERLRRISRATSGLFIE